MLNVRQFVRHHTTNLARREHAQDAGRRSDGGVFVRDDLVPDPLAYYILAKA